MSDLKAKVASWCELGFDLEYCKEKPPVEQKLHCTFITSDKKISCSSINKVRYCERETNQVEVCVPDNGDSADNYKRLLQVLKGLNAHQIPQNGR